MGPSVHVRSIAGALTPPLFIVLIVVLTFAERDFLRRVEWSAVHRTKVEWPSLLELGDYGWVMISAFVVCGICGVALASAMWSLALVLAERVEAALVGVISMAIAIEAFRPDSPQSSTGSFHNAIHNDVFAAMPIASLAATASTVVATRQLAPDAARIAAHVGLLALMMVGLALTSIASIAQVGRYIYFAALLVWIELIALRTLARSGESSPSEPVSTQRHS